MKRYFAKLIKKGFVTKRLVNLGFKLKLNTDVIIKPTISLVIIAISMLLLIRCANPVSPEGGAKDILPPRMTEAIPPNKSLFFSAKEITLTFDEFIHLKDPTGQIIAAPPTFSTTDLKMRGKKLVLTIEDSLRPNTTYTINFANSIQDLTENNIFRDFRYVFSTGSYIDSLSLNGKVINSFNLSPEKEVYAMLYLNNNDTIPLDSLPFLVKPYYITKTNEVGEFKFTNLADQQMLLFALKDQNGNAIYDLPNESVAFYDTLVRGYYIPPVDTAKKDSFAKAIITKDTAFAIKEDTTLNNKALADTGVLKSELPIYVLKMFEETDTIQRVLKNEISGEGRLAVYFKTALNDATIASLSEADTGIFISEYSTKRDTLLLWLTRNQDDTLRFQVSDKGLIIDTVEFAKPKKKKPKDETIPRLSATSNVSDGFLNHFRKEPVFTFSYPIKSADLTRITISDEKDTAQAKGSFADSLHRRIVIHNNWQEDTKYQLVIPDSALFALNGLTNDSLVYQFKTKSLRDLGSLAFEITTKEQSPNFIFQLLNEKENVIEERQIKNLDKMIFEYLSPGIYKMKVVIDRNSNGKWDSGLYSRRIQPETVIYFSGDILVRANWDVVEKWEF